MPRLISSSLFKHCLVAACLISHEHTPIHIPPGPTHDACISCENEPPVAKLAGRGYASHVKSAKKKRRRAIVDSGATIHCIKDRSLFTHLDTSKHVDLRVANNQMIRSEGVGTCAIEMTSSDGKKHVITLNNCVYSPMFSENLISTRRLWLEHKISCHLGSTSYLKCHFSNAHYYFSNDCRYDITPAARRVDSSLDMDLIHSRFNHCGQHRLRKLFDVTEGLPTYVKGKHVHDPHKPCPACVEGGSKKKAFAKRNPRNFTYFGERLSSDLCGPFPKSVDGFKYVMCFVDAATDISAIYLLKSRAKEEVKDAFQSFLNDYKEHLNHGKRVTWHTDNGGEFMSHDLDEFCEEFAVARSFSVPYAPPQNAQAERLWGLLLKPTRTLLTAARIDTAFWSYAIKHANHCRNVMPSYSQPGMRTPWEALTGNKPDLSRFRIWGCLIHYLIPDHEIESKISPRAWPAVHLGFDPLRNGYIVYIPHKNRITTGFHVIFQEHRFLKVTPEHVTDLPRIPKPFSRPQMLYKEPRDKRPPPPALPGTHELQRDRGSKNLDRTDDMHATVDSDSDDNEMTDDRPTRVGTYGKPPPRTTRNPNPGYVNVIIDDVHSSSYAIKIEDTMSDVPVPKTYEEAEASHLRERWMVAMEKEISDLIKHDTWELVSLDQVPKDRKIVKSRFVYTIKYNRDGTIERFKARFVACGYSQVKGIDFEETFSATLRSTSFRLLCAIAAGKRMTLDHFDVTSAFTQSEIDADIYVQAPPGSFTQKDSKGRPKVLKLRKALYGTKQASKLWQDTLIRHLTRKMGFTQLKNDPCLFIKNKTIGSKTHAVIAGVYVDDVIVAHDSLELLSEFKREFTGAGGFNAQHVGKLSWFLGIAVDQHQDHSVTIHQTKYVEKLLDKFIPSHAKSSRAHTMPCDPESFQRLSVASNDAERERVSKLPYLELVGSLLYLSTMTRPDIAYHMSVLCSFMHNPSVECYNSAIDLLLYVGHTRHYHIRYSGSVVAPEGVRIAPEIARNSGFVAYSDASWHKPDHLGYNMYGYLVMVFGGPVAFAAKRLKVVAHSSAEAEYAAASHTCKEIAFVRNVCYELQLQLRGPVCLAVDNEAAIKIASNRGVTGRTKHFSDAIHYIRHMVDHMIVRVRYVSTHNQLADGFTKPLSKALFRSWCARIMSGVSEEFL